ncbi:NAD(P)H-binding protein [Phormidium tenue FACHB-886]|nr:NAD(P)H-binding protein [Phormidium tenue FACHB-886]
MKLVIFGATGSIGRQLVQQALEQGHIVTAFVRDRAKLDDQHQNLKVVQGDVLNLEEVERGVKQSHLDWTIVRPSAFIDGSRTGQYRQGFPGTDKTTKLKISRADVADFMLQQLTNNSYLYQTPGISY